MQPHPNGVIWLIKKNHYASVYYGYRYLIIAPPVVSNLLPSPHVPCRR